jgi:Glycosyl hydrolases family 43
MAPVAKLLIFTVYLASVAHGLALPEAAPKDEKHISSTSTHRVAAKTTSAEEHHATSHKDDSHISSDKEGSSTKEDQTTKKGDHTSNEDHSSKTEGQKSKETDHSSKKHSEPSPTPSADAFHGTHKPSNPVHGPLVGWYFADPSLIEEGGTWYSFASSFSYNAKGFERKLQLAKSSNFVSWEYVDKEILPGNHAQRWGPDVIKSPNNEYIMNYAKVESSGTCLYTATATSIDGPYQNESEFYCEKGGKNHNVIDGAYFQDHDGSLYIVFKSSTVHKNGSKNTEIMVQRVQDSGPHWGRKMMPGSSANSLLHNEK